MPVLTRKHLVREPFMPAFRPKDVRCKYLFCCITLLASRLSVQIDPADRKLQIPESQHLTVQNTGKCPMPIFVWRY